MPDLRTTTIATIANGASLSAAVDLGDYSPGVVGVLIPAAWTAAALTLQGSSDGVTFGDLYAADGTEYTVQAAAGRFVAIPPGDLVGPRYLKLRSGTSASPVAQGAARALVLVVRPL